MIQPYRLDSGGLIDRSAPVEFSFNGRKLGGFRGDTVASALLANGVRLVGRSFKYHRPRGILGCGAEEPNAILQVGQGARAMPNLRATQTEVLNGLTAVSTNCWPGVEFDIGEINSLAARALPAGFYYKTFMWPGWAWDKYEKVIRGAAGFGRTPDAADPDHYEKHNHHCDVLVVGAGPAGLNAALAAGRAGARVILCDEQHLFGGSLTASGVAIGGASAVDHVAGIVAELESLPNVRLLLRTTAYGYLDHNFLALAERVTDHMDAPPAHLPRGRLWRVRARRVVLATGAIERPLVFPDNDRPGIMLCSAVSAYIHRYAVVPGRNAVVFTNNDSAYLAVLDLLDAGARVGGVVDVRHDIDTPVVQAVKARGVEVLDGCAVTGVIGRKQVRTVEIMGLDPGRTRVTGRRGSLGCDLLAVSGGYSPAVHLHAQSGGRPVFDEERACFLPGKPVQDERSAGAAAGEFTLAGCIADGRSRGEEAALAVGFEPVAAALPQIDEIDATALVPMWRVPTPGRHAPKQFVDYQNDTSATDLELAVREGYRSIEHIKRYTALGFGTDQGKLGNINGMAIAAAAMGQSIAQTGTTTFRPAYTPVTFGTIAGRELGEHFDPVRLTAIHGWHEERGAEFENVGQWKRPWFFPLAGETMEEAVNRECLATRRSVGIMDASTLGKIDIRGPDSAAFLNLLYTNAWSKLAIGRCRYGLMLGEDGMVMDDGVTTRVGENHYHMTTTTGGAAHVLAWMERWLQTEWPHMKVYLTSVTDQWATISLAGPRSREVLSDLTTDIDLDNESFPFMSMKTGTVAGVAARVFRISFSGELAFEINVQANHGRAVWEAAMAAGEAHGITPYGTETMHVLRAEKGYIIVGQDTDGSVTPADLGMDWIVSTRKDFIGRRSLFREDCKRVDRKQLVGLRTEAAGEVIPEGAQLVDDPRHPVPVPMVGHVSSSYYSVTLERSIALALVKGGRQRMGQTVYAPLADGRSIGATICDPVFYDREGERQHV